MQLETSKFTTETPYNVQVTIEPIEKCVIFKDIFPRLSRTKVIIQDFPRGMGTLTTGVRRISRTLLNPSRWRKRVDCGRHSAETDYILPRLCTKCSERGLVCLMWVRLCGTACESIRRMSSQAAFKRRLQILLLSEAFGIVCHLS